MRRSFLPPLLLAAALSMAGCSGGEDGPSGELSAADQDACDTLYEAGDPPDTASLYAAFGPGATEKLSTDLAGYAQLVGAEAQLAETGAPDPTKLAEYIGQMTGVCSTLGWRASS